MPYRYCKLKINHHIHHIRRCVSQNIVYSSQRQVSMFKLLKHVWSHHSLNSMNQELACIEVVHLSRRKKELWAKTDETIDTKALKEVYPWEWLSEERGESRPWYKSEVERDEPWDQHPRWLWQIIVSHNKLNHDLFGITWFSSIKLMVHHELSQDLEN